MSQATLAFDRWIRTAFPQMNEALENLYFEQDDRANTQGIGDALKAAIRDEGHGHIVALWREGNTGEGFDSAFDVLGNVGLYMAALRRHELTNPAREDRSPFAEASSLSLHLGASIGMAPRFATAHLAHRNRAVAGVRKSFTFLADEFLFIDENARGILCLQRAADALFRIVPLGVSNPVADVQFEAAAHALDQAIAINARLFAALDVERFFFSVRPYYKPYRVGRQEYRGANAGDFAGINELDLLLGLTRASDPHYAQLLVDKMLYMLPEDQARLRDCMRHRSLLDELLLLADDHAAAPWFQAALGGLLGVIDRFAETARQHHALLVDRFIAGPAATLDRAHMAGITASGPPLDALLRALQLLHDFRTAAPRSDVETRHADLARLRALLVDPSAEPVGSSRD
ncbi:PrnB family protein [Sphingomonas baiyangensis]|nr:monodechloroaminopyrrolnitrin synthase PrnB family protein [Sphingomonas baiyangensis]